MLFRSSPEHRPQPVAPPQVERPAPPERAVQVPYTPPSEDEQEAVRNFLQDTLQRKIDEDENFRSVLYEASKAYLEKRKEEGR